MSKEKTSFRTYYGSILKELWRSSKWFRVILIASLVWAIIQLALQVGLIFIPISDQVGADLQASYLPAAEHFLQQQDLYPQGSLAFVEGHYLYAPAFAILFIPFLRLPLQITLLVHLFLHIAAYCLLFFLWGKIFQEFRLEKASKMLVQTIPAWLIFSAFWNDLLYLNIYTFMALIATLFILAILKEDLLPASIWLTLMLATKPQWAIVAAVPLLVGRYRFFIKLVLGALVGYVIVGVISILASSPVYVINQYREQFQFLARLSRDYPWRGTEAGFLGYNHSIKQIIVFFAGATPVNLLLVNIVKYILCIPLGVVVIWRLIHPVRRTGDQLPQITLELSFLLYLGAFLWLDLVWEITLGIAIFTYLLAIVNQRFEKAFILGVFIPYAAVDIWRIVTYAIGAPLINDSYFAWDYSIYVPLIMIVILVLYGVLIKRNWPTSVAFRISPKEG